ncbi:MAG TPA: branched-chain amino acid ABC transporter permease [Chloroflexota bacterium]|nr:branched-chain amino acid ABC transporter permease [Chloroflexota bacterium]
MIGQQLVNALMLGSNYALVAIGYTLVFGVLRLLNFAHPNVCVLGGFLLFSAVGTLALPLPAAIAVVIVGGAVLGLATERLCFRPAEHLRDELAPAISSVAFALVLTELVAKVWGAEPRRLPPLVTGATFDLGLFQVSSIQLVILGLSFGLMLGVDYLLQHTRMGYALRAVAEQRDVAQLLGVNVRATVVWAFLLSGVLAALAGMLLAMRIGLADPNVGLSYGLRALAVMVLGGLGNVRGAMVAGLLVGLVDVMALAFLSQAYSSVAAWVLLLVVLLCKPSGLLGTRLQRESI